MEIIDYDLISVQEARILAENAREASKSMLSFPQEKLDEIVKSMVHGVSGHVKELAVMSSEETEYGKWEDKLVKNRFVCEALPPKLSGMRCVGVIFEDKDKKVMDVGVPLGVIVALPPATSPVSTVIYKALIAVKSGNAIIFSPHPRARGTICRALDLLIEAAEGAGLPKGGISCMRNVTGSGTVELMNHPATSLIMNTGVPGMLDAANRSGKPVIYGGAGNGPVFIERTADIMQAAADIVASKTFDNGIVSAAEQSIIVDRPVACEAKKALVEHGAYFMEREEAKALGALFFFENGRTNPEMVGISAKDLARRAGFTVPDHAKVLISEEKYISSSKDDPYLKEKLCPVMAYYVEDDWMGACEKCIELLLSEKQGHTLVVHTGDEEVVRQFALKKPVSRVLVNTPAAFGGMGATTNLFPAMTLGSGSAGYGITSDNVSPMNLIYIRKVGFGVRKIETVVNKGGRNAKNGNESLITLYNILQKMQKEHII